MIQPGKSKRQNGRYATQQQQISWSWYENDYGEIHLHQEASLLLEKKQVQSNDFILNNGYFKF
jgi:hypothetical protein